MCWVGGRGLGRGLGRRRGPCLLPPAQRFSRPSLSQAFLAPLPFTFRAPAQLLTLRVPRAPRSSYQWVYMRAMLDLAFNERAPGMQSGVFKEKDFTTEQTEAMEAFFLESYYFPQMLNYPGKPAWHRAAGLKVAVPLRHPPVHRVPHRLLLSSPPQKRCLPARTSRSSGTRSFTSS